MNEHQKRHIQDALKKGVRLDGRKLDEFRKITIEKDNIKHAEGSVKISCGNTELIVGVKMTVGTPFSDRPANGALMVNAEMIPMSSSKFESGPPGIDAIEASRVIDRGIRESKSIDEGALCIVEGEKVWIANIDVYPINYDGNMIDVGGIGAITAAMITRMPKLDENNNADYKDLSDEKLPVTKIPVPITIVKVGESLLVDPTDDEKEAADAWITVTTLNDGTICSLQKGGDEPLTVNETEKMFDLATKKGAEIRKIIEKVVA